MGVEVTRKKRNMHVNTTKNDISNFSGLKMSFFIFILYVAGKEWLY